MKDLSLHSKQMEALDAISKAPTSSLQDLIDFIGSVLKPFEVGSVSIYSREIKSINNLVLIASTDEKNVANLFLYSDDYDERSIIFGDFDYVIFFEFIPLISLSPTIARIIEMKIDLVIGEKRSAIRKSIVESSYRSKDVNSLSFRIVRNLIENYTFCDELTIFIREDNRICLAASNCRIVGIEKRDIFYTNSTNNNIVKSVLKTEYIYESSLNGIEEQTFDKNFLTKGVFSRMHWPINLNSTSKAISIDDRANSLGVIRVSNMVRRGALIRWETRPTQYDFFIMGYIAEIIAALLRQYFQAQDTISDINRLTHGIGASIDAAINNAIAVRETLFYTEEEKSGSGGKLRFSLTDSTKALSSLSTALRYITDLEYFLNDLHFQFSKTYVTHFDIENISNLHTKVFMPVVRLAPAIAAVNSCNEPMIGSLRQNDSLDIPAVIGNVDALVSVFRNLIENSIKYSRHKTARIEFSFSYDREFVSVDVRDYGIGVPDNERDELFKEGFRSLIARATASNRGAGLGLAYCSRVMEALNGDISHVKCEVGAIFRVRIRRSV